MSGGPDPIDRLADRVGIERRYWDVSGREYHAPDDTVIALLSAMGFQAGSAPERRETLEEIEADERTRLLPPCYRLPASGEQVLPLPAAGAGDRDALDWRIETEAGEVVEGGDFFSALPWCDDTSGRRLFRPPNPLPLGRHRLELRLGSAQTFTTLIVPPDKAYGVAAAAGQDARLWGATAPLYGLRSARNFGIGDYSDLAALAEVLAGRGADFLGINPVHALYPGEPWRASPYSPSNRLFLNTAHIAPDRVAEFAGNAAAEDHLARNAEGLKAVRAGDLVDYGAVDAILRPLFEILYDRFKTAAADDRRAAFTAFCTRGGIRLRRQAIYDALAEHFAAPERGFSGSGDWPDAYRNSQNPAVARFAAEHADRVGFYTYLQWLADEQLDTAQVRAKAAGMAFGLYLDLAIGATPGGAETWSDPGAYGRGVSLGAPPDAFAPNGQNWSIVPFNPRALADRGFEPFAALLAAVMRHAGLIRIDHVLGLARNFWIPEGGLPGAYVRFPLDDLLAVAAIESRRAGTVIVGEDLGNVPEGLRGRMEETDILGCRVVYFEKEWDGRFRPPEHYPCRVIAAIGTHDLPTLAGFWAGRDIDWRERNGRAAEAVAADRRERAEERRQLAALLSPNDPASCAPDGEVVPDLVVERLHRRLAQSPAALAALRLEDALGEVEQANLPGTVDGHPNWCRRLPVAVEELGDDRRVTRLAGIMNGERGRKSDPSP